MTGQADIIVERFRQAACGMVDWADALDGLARGSGGHVGQLGVIDRHQALAVNIVSGVGPDAVDAYFAARGHDPAVNPRTRALFGAAPAHCMTDEDFVSVRARETLPIYRNLFRCLDVPYGMQVRLETMPDFTTGLIVLRSQSRGAADAAALALLRAVMAGVASAIHAGMLLGTAQEAALVTTAETLSGPAFLLGRDLRVVSLSPAAEAIVRAGTCLTIRRGRLHAVDDRNEGALADAYRAATLPATAERRLRPLALLCPDGGDPLVSDMCPLPARTTGPLSGAGALLTIRVPRPLDPDGALAMLRHAYALTAAEADVALRLAEGNALDRIAAARGSTTTTIRTQIKALFEKTGTHRQADLIVKLRAFR